jgi:hypothetical protein
MKFDTGYFIIAKIIEYEITTTIVREVSYHAMLKATECNDCD